MVRWLSLAGGIAVFLLIAFFAASAFAFPLMSDPLPLVRGVAVAGVILLIADVFLPIPSSLVMAAHGSLFGVVGGTLLSMIGSTLAALTGFAIGRWGNDAIRRLVTPREHDRAGALLQRWGVVAVALTRPIPILAETVAILAGSSPLTWTQTAVAAAAGSLAPSLVYAWAGAHATDAASHAIIFAGVLVATGAMWLIGRRFTSARSDASV